MHQTKLSYKLQTKTAAAQTHHAQELQGGVKVEGHKAEAGQRRRRSRRRARLPQARQLAGRLLSDCTRSRQRPAR